jgi:TonB family protein
MNPFEFSLTDSVSGFGVDYFFLMTVIKVTVILALALLIHAALPRASSASRNLILRLTLTAVLLLPYVSLVAPSLTIINFKSSLDPTGVLIPNMMRPIEPIGPVDSGLSVNISPVFWIMSAWFIGLTVILIRFLIGILGIARLVNRSSDDESGELGELAEPLIVSLGIKKAVSIRISPAVQTPFVFGLFRPVIIIPSSIRNWTKEDIRMVLHHELAHIRRNDLFWGYAAILAGALHWFNPLVWIVKKKMIMESDKTCDDFVLCGGVRWNVYAERLMTIAKDIRRHRLAIDCGADMIRKSQLEERIMSISNRKIRATAVPKLALAAMIALLAFVIVPLAALQVRAEEPIPPKEEPVEIDPVTDENLPEPDVFVPVEVMPEMIEVVEPVYPECVKKENCEGKVWVKCLVDKKGVVRKAMVYKPSKYKVLDEAAVAAAPKCKFKPAVQNGQPVAVWITYPVVFANDGKADSTVHNKK